MTEKWTMRSLRRANDISQKEMAEKLGVSEQQYRRYESFQVIPSVQTAYNFADLFNENVNNIIFFKDKVS